MLHPIGTIFRDGDDEFRLVACDVKPSTELALVAVINTNSWNRWMGAKWVRYTTFVNDNKIYIKDKDIASITVDLEAV